MLRGAGVFARVAMRRGIAAKSNATRLAGAKMNPGSADLYALLALEALRSFHRLQRADVRTSICAHARKIAGKQGATRRPRPFPRDRIKFRSFRQMTVDAFGRPLNIFSPAVRCHADLNCLTIPTSTIPLHKCLR
jgi:hypothetical protein